MDPMDFTMEDGQASRHSSTATRCQYQQPQNSTNGGLGSHSSRDGQHYDPVHDTNSWFQPPSNANMPSRPSFTAPPQAMPQWMPGPYAHMPSWQSFSDVQSGVQGQTADSSAYRQNIEPMGMSNSPWGEMRAFDPLSFNYHAFPQSTNNTTPSQANAIRNPSQAAGGALNHLAPSFASAFTPRDPHSSLLHREYNSRPSRIANPLTVPMDPTQRPLSDSDIENSSRNSIPASAALAGERAAARFARYHNTRMTWTGQTSGQRRQVPNTWDSDDEDEEFLSEEGRHHHVRGELLFSPEMDEDRVLAAVRGSVLSMKKLPSKEAIASLEKLKVEDLTEADKTCIICYNEFGVSNPEGLIEAPLRLPKCKHIFGDKCIKKWFLESDSCPYCRDKLPSDLSSGKNVALETIRATRDRVAFLQAAQQSIRARHSYIPRYPISEDPGSSRTPAASRRAQDEYELIMARATEWGHPSPSEFSPEGRRRQTRGRNGSSRTPHHSGRPTSVGSLRLLNPSPGFQGLSQAAQVYRIPSNNNTSSNTQRGSITLGVLRQANGSTAITTSSTQTPPRNRNSATLSSSPPEQPSPPVAFGSGENNRDAQTYIEIEDSFPGSHDALGSQWANTFREPHRTPSPLDSSETSASPRVALNSSYRPSFTNRNTAESHYSNRGERFQPNMNELPQPRWSQ